jgi:hypothetical protein
MRTVAVVVAADRNQGGCTARHGTPGWLLRMISAAGG